MTERPDWQRAFELLGQYAEGDLRTIKVDADGRISALIVDSMDAWGGMLTIGNAELAVRLGSPVVDEQRGRVQYIDTFEEGAVRWQLGSSGVGGSAAITPLCARSGGYAVRLISGSTFMRTAYMSNYSIVLPNARTGFAYSLSFDGVCDEHSLEILRYDGAIKHDIRLKFDDVTDQFRILDDTPIWQPILATNLGTRSPWHFHSLKLVVDLVNRTYLRLMLDNEEVDLSEHSYGTWEDERHPMMTVTITQKSPALANSLAVVDNFITTTAEPE